MADQYAKPLKQFLNLYAKINRELAVDATKVGERFLRAAEVLNEQVGPRAVRASRGGSFNAAVAEAVFVATMEAVEKDLSLSGLASKIEDLNADEEFQTSTTSGTSSKDQVEARLSTARRHILR
jgi:hypothetical protein